MSSVFFSAATSVTFTAGLATARANVAEASSGFASVQGRFACSIVPRSFVVALRVSLVLSPRVAYSFHYDSLELLKKKKNPSRLCLRHYACARCDSIIGLYSQGHTLELVRRKEAPLKQCFESRVF